MKEHLQTFCKVSYWMRKLKNKGALLVLVWSFMVMCAVNYLFNKVGMTHYFLLLLAPVLSRPLDSLPPSRIVILKLQLTNFDYNIIYNNLLTFSE